MLFGWCPWRLRLRGSAWGSLWSREVGQQAQPKRVPRRPAPPTGEPRASTPPWSCSSWRLRRSTKTLCSVWSAATSTGSLGKMRRWALGSGTHGAPPPPQTHNNTHKHGQAHIFISSWRDLLLPELNTVIFWIACRMRGSGRLCGVPLSWGWHFSFWVLSQRSC